VESSGKVFSVSSQWNDHFILRVLFLIHFTKHGDFQLPKNLTPAWAQIEYSYKVLLGESILERFTGECSELDQYSIAEGMVEEFNKKIWFTHVTTVHGQLKTIVNLSNNTNVTIVETDNPDVVKIANIDIDFNTHVRLIIMAHTQNVLNHWMGIMKNIQIVPIPHVIKDELANIRNGYSFLTDPTNASLVESLRLKIENHSAFSTTPPAELVDCFLKEVQDFTEKLLILVHLTTGIPPRATETTSILMYNNPLLGKRNLYILGRQMFVSLIYKKTMQKQTNFVPIVRFLPAIVSNIVFSYMSLMRPMYDILNFYLEDAYKPIPMLSLKDVESFRTRFKDCFTKVLGVNIGISTYRHLVIHYMRNAVKKWRNDINSTGSVDQIMNDLAGHSEQTDLENYATTKITRSFSMTEFDFQSYRKVCAVWHNLLGFKDNEESLANLVQAPLKIEVPEPLKMPSFCVSVSAVSKKDPLELLRQHTSFKHFKSKEQYLGILHTLYSQKDLMLSLPTGGGKSLSYQLPSLAFPDRIIIVVVPLVSICRDILDNCQSLNIGCYKFSDLGKYKTQANGGIYIVQYGEDERVIKHLHDFIGFNCKTIHAIYFDEAHLLSDWGVMMECNKFIGLRGTQRVKYVFLSASLHVENIQVLKEMMVLEDADCISLYDDHFNMEYVVSVSETSDQVFEGVQDELNISKGKTLVFFPDIQTLQHYKAKLVTLNPLSFYGSMSHEEKHKTLGIYEKTDRNIIFCTTALCAGYNYALIETVIVVGALHSWDNVMQAFGRAGRNGKKCKGVLALTAKQEKDKVLKGLLLRTECFRKVASQKHGQVIPICCSVLYGSELCWFCQTRIPNLKRKRLQVQESRVLKYDCEGFKPSDANQSSTISSYDNMTFQNDESTQLLLINDRASMKRIQLRNQNIQTLENIFEMAESILTKCVFCYFKKGVLETHERCKIENGKCLKCLGNHSWRDCTFKGKDYTDSPRGCCKVCYLPIDVHTKLGKSQAGYGLKCQFKDTSMNDNIKYWIILLAKNPSCLLCRDLMQLSNGKILEEDFIKNFTILKNLYLNNVALFLQLINDTVNNCDVEE